MGVRVKDPGHSICREQSHKSKTWFKLSGSELVPHDSQWGKRFFLSTLSVDWYLCVSLYSPFLVQLSEFTE